MPYAGDDVSELEARQEPRLVRALEMIAPGTAVREGIDSIVQGIVREFGGLDEILAAGDGDLESVEGVGDVRAKDIREGLRRLQEINLVDRYLQT